MTLLERFDKFGFNGAIKYEELRRAIAIADALERRYNERKELVVYVPDVFADADELLRGKP